MLSTSATRTMRSTHHRSITWYRGRDVDWHEEVLRRCPALRSGFEPSRWIRNAHVQNAMTVMRGDAAPPLAWDDEQRLVAPDGGTVSVQWLGLDEPAPTPVLVVLHTITGSGDGLRRSIAALRQGTGWVVAALNRRGHGGLPLTAPRINTMGSTDDLRRQLAAIASRRPGAALYGLGVSAGSGLLVRYLGEEGPASRLRAAVALCPAYDIRDAFAHVQRAYDRYMTRRMVEFFLVRNRDVLGGIDGYARCAASTTMAEFHDRLHPLAGFDTREAYYQASNPMDVAREVTVPALVINAADDPVCAERNVLRHAASLEALPRLGLAVTRRGGHCGFFEDWSHGPTWSDRAIAEYLMAAHALLGG